MKTKYKKFCDLRRNFKKAILVGNVRNVKQAIAKAVKMPYPSFYISGDHCYKIINSIEGDKNYISSIKNKETIRKYIELYRRFCILREQNPTANKIDLCYEVVQQEAPELYMSVNAAYNFYFYNRKKEQLLQKLGKI